MIYILEMLGTEDLGNPVRIFKIGYTKDFKKRLTQYKTYNASFKIYKLLDGEDFDREAERILHKVLSYFKYNKRPEMFEKNGLNKDIINSINTTEDISNLEIFMNYRNHRYSHLSQLDRYYIKNIKLLDYNWGLIKAVFHKRGRDLIWEMLKSGETDLFRYATNTFGISIIDLPKEVSKGPKTLSIIFYNKYRVLLLLIH